MFSSAPNPADVATTIAVACLPRRIDTSLATRPQITTDALPQTTVWLPVKIDGDGALPTAGAVLVLTEPDQSVTVGGSLVYALTAAATVVVGVPARRNTAVDRVVWSHHFTAVQNTAAGTAEKPSPNSGRLVCVATGTHVFQHDLVWLKLAVEGMVRTRLGIVGPPGTTVDRYGGRWTKVIQSGDVTTAVLRVL